MWQKTKKAPFNLSILIGLINIEVIIIIVIFVRLVFFLANRTQINVPSCGLYTFSVLVEVKFQYFTIPFKSENLNRRKDVFAVDGFPLFVFAFLAGFTCDEGNELRDAFLYCLFCIFGDFGILWQRFFHYTTDVCDGQEARVVGCIPKIMQKCTYRCFCRRRSS